MPFHVEIRAGINHARAFNLNPDDLRRTVLEPWLTGRPLELGEHEWDPRESSLRIIEGPHLAPPDLSFGQGWSNAERSGEEVTRRVLSTTETPPQLPDAFLVEAEVPEATVAEMLSGQRLCRPLAWPRPRRRSTAATRRSRP